MRKYLLLIFVFLLAWSISCNHLYYAATHIQEPVRGIYVTAPTTKKPQFNHLLSLINNTDLNAMVIDIKDDHGNLTFVPEKNSPYYSVSRPYITNPASLMTTLKTNNIYPIARIVVFKDNVLSAKNPSLSFKTPNEGLWKNPRGDSFTNPFLKEVWDYNIGMALRSG